MFAARGGFNYVGAVTPPPVTYQPWLGLMVPATSSGTYANSVLGTDGSMYAIGVVQGATPDYSTVTCIDKDGNLVWQQYASSTGNEIRFYAIAIDSSNNIYIVGQRNSTQFNLLTKLNSSGAEQWSTTFTFEADGAYQPVYQAIAIDETYGRVFVNGAGGSNAVGFAVFDASTGDIVTRRKITYASAPNFSRLQIVGTTIHAVGTYSSAQAAYATFNFDSSGTINSGSVITLDRTAFNDGFNDLYVDGSDTYCVGFTRHPTTSTYDVPLVAKYTSGSLVWQKSFDVLSTLSSRAYRVWLDESNNIYVGASYLNNTALEFIKMDSSGSLLWANGMNLGATGNEIDRGIFYYNTGVYFSSDRTNGSTTVYGSVPSDGSIPGTGTYTVNGNTITYVALTQNANTASLTEGSASPSSIDSSPFLSQSSAGLTFTTSTDSYYQVDI